jgi:hypothetical protein
VAWPDWEVGDLLTADALNERQPRTVYKTAIETRTNTTTLAADSELSISVEQGYIYVIRAVINYSAAADGIDLKYGWSVPTGSSIWWSSGGLDITATTQSGSFNTHFNSTATGNGNRQVGAVDEGPVALMLNGILTPAIDGDLTFLWAQGTSSASALNVRETSFIELNPIRKF